MVNYFDSNVNVLAINNIWVVANIIDLGVKIWLVEDIFEGNKKVRIISLESNGNQENVY